MMQFVVRRIASVIPVLLVVTLVAFGMRLLIPGDPAIVLAGDGASPDDVQQLRVRLGLDRPLIGQMEAWYVRLLHGDLGTSILLDRPVLQVFMERAPVTAALSVYGMVITLVVGVTCGVVAAVARGTWADWASMTFALAGVSVPNFWLALVLIFVFSVELGWLPTGGYVPIAQGVLPWLRNLTMPAISLALLQLGLLARITRSSMLEVLRQDYIRTARAIGIGERVIYWKLAFRNALVPIVTVVGIIFSLSMGGAVVIEQVYALPGVGRFIVSSILSRDYPVLQGGLLITAGMFVLINLIVDLLYAAIDPRVRYVRRGE